MQELSPVNTGILLGIAGTEDTITPNIVHCKHALAVHFAVSYISRFASLRKLFNWSSQIGAHSHEFLRLSYIAAWNGQHLGAGSW